MTHSGIFLLTASEKRTLFLPPLLRRGLALAPGDLLSTEPSLRSIGFQIYREVLAHKWELVDRETRWMNLEMFLRRPLAAIDARERLVIPRKVFRVWQGETYKLTVFKISDRHILSLDRRPVVDW